MSVAVVDRILALPHAIEPQALVNVVLPVAERQGTMEALAARRQDMAAKEATRERVLLEAVVSKPLDRIAGMRYSRSRGPVAVLDINGPIYRYASMFDDISAISSVQRLAIEFQSLLNDDAYHTIVLLVDSPGGEIDGIHQFAEMIFNARDKKRIVAYIDGDGCSAAYWLAAAASEVFIDKTARVGSIGVRMSMLDPRVARQGMYVIVDSEAPDKDPDPATTDGMAELRRQIEPLAAIFRAAISTYRDLPEENIRALRGGVRVGQEAIDAGLADNIAAFETLMDDLIVGPSSTKGTKAMALSDRQFLEVLHTASDDQKESLMEALQIKAQFPAKMEEITKALEGVAASQKELNLAIQAIGAGNEESTKALEALNVTVKAQDDRLNAIDERLKALEGEATAVGPNGGYRASQAGPPPGGQGQGYHESAAANPNGIDQNFFNFLGFKGTGE